MNGEYIQLRWGPDDGEWWVCRVRNGKPKRINLDKWNGYKRDERSRAIAYAQGKASNFNIPYRGEGPHI
jgi:hypothetical protein